MLLGKTAKPYRFASSSLWDSYNDPSVREELPEVKAASRLTEFLRKQAETNASAAPSLSPSISRQAYRYLPSKNDYRLSLEASMATFALHVNARIASSVGKGFYTIGPCGEESLSAVGILLEECDSSALHYRHTATSLARQLKASKSSSTFGGDDALGDLLLGRARGYTVSRLDPVTGGVHCCIGGGDNEFVVTSTLASQCPSAVGRALGYSLARQLGKTNDNGQRPISFVSIGDGSLHNHHFLSSWALAQHARHKNTRCPVVFGISENGFSISYRTQGFVENFFRSSDESDLVCPVFRVKDSSDMLEIYSVTKQAMEYSRKQQGPSVVLYQNLKRRFGHAATDRQFSYMSNEEIEEQQSSCVVQASCIQAVELLGYETYETLRDRWTEIQQRTEAAFETAINEPRVTLSEMMDRVSVPLAPIPISASTSSPEKKETDEAPKVMRKHMTRALEEAMDQDESVVYLGEDVRHGGYYLVTDGLADKFPHRVLDFPPDETTLLGAALGFSQLGLTPIVEIPYAKYLDCGADIFYEIAIQHWLTNGESKSTSGGGGNGMVIRIQGFDNGVFGGNFHTHNSLAHVPPGIDLVCFSNGADWVRGFRHALWQAKHGRIVVVVDCTKLLNTRHVHGEDKDRAWEFAYPEASPGKNGDTTPMMGFESVTRYSACEGNGRYPFTREEIGATSTRTPSPVKAPSSPGRIAIVTYGNGVAASLQARRGLLNRQLIETEEDLDVIDCHYLSDVPEGLERLLAPMNDEDSDSKHHSYEHVLFADICKEGPGSNIFSSTITALQQKGLLPKSWGFMGAPRTYNPLGSTVTFLNSDRIEAAVVDLLGLGNHDDRYGSVGGNEPKDESV
jgi:2-oxoisovalerate dehydrogenase E1 component